MWQKMNMHGLKASRKKIVSYILGLGIISLLLIGCGGGVTTAETSTADGISSGSVSRGTTNQPSVAAPSGTDQHQGSSGQYGPQYLVKTLQVSMEVQNPTQSASDLQQWIAFNAPQSTSDGSDYESAGNGQYTVTLTFLVDVAHYTQVEAYLRDYAGQKGRTLDSLKETVQDVTNDYVDAESTLTNLRAEQQRLLDFMKQAQSLSDAVNIEQQLTQVEGQINQIEAHINALKGQTTFYTVTVTVQPVGVDEPPSSPWSVIPVWQGAWSSVVTVGQVVVAILVWLLAYSVYIIPLGILAWLIRKRPWRARMLPQVKPAIAFAMPIPASTRLDTETPVPVVAVDLPASASSAPETSDTTDLEPMPSGSADL